MTVRRKVMVVPVRMGRDWEVLVLRRGPDRGGVWAPVTGNVEEGETTRAAAARELEEETGLSAGAAALHPTPFVNRFSKQVGGRPVAFVEEVFAAVVRPGLPVKVSHEHVEARWVPAPEAIGMVDFDGCKEGVRQAIAAVEPKAP